MQLGIDSRRVLIFLAAPRPFCVALSPPVHWHARFYIVALTTIFSLDFVSGDLALTELEIIWLPLFWRTWARAHASSRSHVLAWHRLSEPRRSTSTPLGLVSKNTQYKIFSNLQHASGQHLLKHLEAATVTIAATVTFPLHQLHWS